MSMDSMQFLNEDQHEYTRVVPKVMSNNFL